MAFSLTPYLVTVNNRFVTVGKRLLEERETRGLTQDQLAKAAGVSVSIIQKIEAGKTVTRRTVAKIAIALDIPLEELAPMSGVSATEKLRNELSADDLKIIADAGSKSELGTALVRIGRRLIENTGKK
jgi:transcriptional regulator with XRE-family HTH domain